MHNFLQRHFRCALSAVMVLKCLKYDWNHFEKDTYVQHVQSKSVIKATYHYNKNITVNDSVIFVCALSASTTELHLHNS